MGFPLLHRHDLFQIGLLLLFHPSSLSFVVIPSCSTIGLQHSTPLNSIGTGDSSNDRKQSGGSYSFVEGSESWHDNPQDEIEAMGGDPFFLEPDPVSEDCNNLNEMQPTMTADTSIEENEGEWDGTVIEDAYFDE